MEYLVIGIATAFNFTIIIKKMRMGRIADAILDSSMFACICYLFSGTFGALATGAISSALISLYLLFFPFSLKELGQVAEKRDNSKNFSRPKNATVEPKNRGKSAYIL